jgi:hypothetical protein
MQYSFSKLTQFSLVSNMIDSFASNINGFLKKETLLHPIT